MDARPEAPRRFAEKLFQTNARAHAFEDEVGAKSARSSRFATYAWLVLAYNLAVILWGAYVRATGSGAGCGSHWPLCNGEVIPRAPEVATLIELTHRATSGVALLLVLALPFWAFRAFPKKHPARLGSVLSVVFILTEALVGAGLVLFELVAGNASLARALFMSVHLANTFVLVAWLTLTAWWGAGEARPRLRGHGGLGLSVGAALAGMLVLGVSGALAALGDTLFPSATLAEGLRQDFSPTAHFLVRLRLLHPTLAVAVGLLLLFTAALACRTRPHRQTHRLAFALLVLFAVQLGAGLLNVWLLAPVWLQLLHLLLADLNWIALVLLAASALARPAMKIQTQTG
ncbi:MAG TPA: COX15/CtaA family protein [Pyrinomonadaceae bacterium]|nr:COX15/CtaA family protein [Pyrinomonadaceae bacterium]